MTDNVCIGVLYMLEHQMYKNKIYELRTLYFLHVLWIFCQINILSLIQFAPSSGQSGPQLKKNMNLLGPKIVK